MTLKEAQQIVEEKVMKDRTGCALMTEYTEEHRTCFTFIYQSSAYLKSKDMLDMVVGHGPILVDKNTGNIFETGSAYSTEHYVNAFESCGDPFASPTDQIRVQGWQIGARKIPATKFIKEVSGLPLNTSKKIIDDALDENPTTFSVSNTHTTIEVVTKLNEYGFICKQLWSNQC